MVIQDDAWHLIRKLWLNPDEISEIASQGLGVPEARWRGHERSISLSDVEFYLKLRKKKVPTSERMKIWKARRVLFGLPDSAVPEVWEPPARVRSQPITTV
jgi:hypothetical protein